MVIRLDTIFFSVYFLFDCIILNCIILVREFVVYQGHFSDWFVLKRGGQNFHTNRTHRRDLSGEFMTLGDLTEASELCFEDA